MCRRTASEVEAGRGPDADDEMASWPQGRPAAMPHRHGDHGVPIPSDLSLIAGELKRIADTLREILHILEEVNQ